MPDQKTTQLIWIKFRLTEEEHTGLKQMAEDDHRSLAGMARKIIRDALKSHTGGN